MKIIASIFLSLVISFSSKVSAQCLITGSLKNMKDTINYLLLEYPVFDSSTHSHIDTIEIKNGKFLINAKIKEPTMVRIEARKIKNVEPEYTFDTRMRISTEVFFEPGNITINCSDSISNISVIGSKSHIEYEKIELACKPYYKRADELFVERNTLEDQGKKEEAKKVTNQMDSIYRQINEEVYGNYLKTNLSSPIILYALSQYAGFDHPEKAEPFFNQLPDSVKNYIEGKRLKRVIELAQKTAIGKDIIDFTQPDTLGNSISLSSLKGKYVLLDFWSSWCGPCRDENPNLLNAYNQYKNKNFTILSVSLDKNPDGKANWLKAIHNDGLTWTHVSDLQGWDNAAAKEYGIDFIPQNFLISPEGKILAKNLRGDELISKLAEILK